MRRADPDVIRQLTAIAKQYPAVVQYVSDWRMKELQALPHVGTNTAQAQGRCQVLEELHKLLLEAPTISAKV